MWRLVFCKCIAYPFFNTSWFLEYMLLILLPKMAVLHRVVTARVLAYKGTLHIRNPIHATSENGVRGEGVGRFGGWIQ